jgi:2-polyprenyl-6-methoxyphenol hydroxylase-like FAD-dependent oxidoreductase
MGLFYRLTLKKIFYFLGIVVLTTKSETIKYLHSQQRNANQGNKMQTITINGQTFPAINAAHLENGMIYHDGSEIVNVQTKGKTTTFTLVFGGGEVSRKVRSVSLIALALEQVAVVF